LAERALVTGASGFIGYHLVKELSQAGAQITCLIRPTSDTSSLKEFDVSFATGDMLDKASLIDPVAEADVVYHLAGATAVFSRKDYYALNEGGTNNLLEACAMSASPPTVLYLSSMAAVGSSHIDSLISESDPPNPVSMYGHSKLAAENVARAWAGKVPITIVRPAGVFGEKDRDTFIIVGFVARGFHLVWGSETMYQSNIHAADLAKVLILAVQKGERLLSANDPIGHGIYNAAYGEIPSYDELGQLVADALQRKKVRILRVPNSVLWGMGLVSELYGRIFRDPNILTIDKARDLTSGSFVCSTAKLQDQLGFKPRVSLQERIRQTIQWYLDQGWL
jgi:nucleoside-diphosphate-sugar epimerase